MEFEVREVFEKKDMKALYTASRMYSKVLRTTEKISRGFGSFLRFFIPFSVFYLMSTFTRLFPKMPKESRGFIGYGIVTMVLVGIFALFPRRGGGLYVQLMWKNYKDKGMEITCQFTESEFTEHTLTSDHRYQYSVIERVIESPTHVFLFVNANNAHIIRKDAFLFGEPDAFGAWVAEKCGKKLIKIK